MRSYSRGDWHSEVVQLGKGLRLHLREEGPDVFVHYSAIQMAGYRTLEEGQSVEFDVGPGKKGEEAQNVRISLTHTLTFFWRGPSPQGEARHG